MGGGTGTGAAPVVAQIAKELDILTVAVVTKPFPFEGRRRMEIAVKGIAELTECVDSVITIPNEKLLTVLGNSANLLDAFKAANDVLLGAVQGIAELITRTGLINVDFADVRTVMSVTGMAMMGSGRATGDGRAREAAEAAIASPLLDNIDLSGARGLLVNITAGMDLSIGEFNEVGSTIKELASEDATVVVGTVIDPEMQSELRVTIVATGIGYAADGSVTTDSAAASSPMRLVQAAVGASQAGAVAPAGTEALRADASSGARQQPNESSGYNTANSNSGRPSPDSDMDYLDIPAFLRRQAD